MILIKKNYTYMKILRTLIAILLFFKNQVDFVFIIISLVIQQLQSLKDHRGFKRTLSLRVLEETYLTSTNNELRTSLELNKICQRLVV